MHKRYVGYMSLYALEKNTFINFWNEFQLKYAIGNNSVSVAQNLLNQILCDFIMFVLRDILKQFLLIFFSNRK